LPLFEQCGYEKLSIVIYQLHHERKSQLSIGNNQLKPDLELTFYISDISFSLHDLLKVTHNVLALGEEADFEALN